MAWPTKTDFVDGDVLTAAQVNNIGTNLNIFNPTSATNGQVWIANGSGGGSFSTPSGAYTLLNSGNLSGTLGVDISNIPGTYERLELYMIDMATPGNNMNLLVNTQTTGYCQTNVRSGTTATETGTNNAQVSTVEGNQSGTFNYQVIIPMYAQTKYQHGQIFGWNINTFNPRSNMINWVATNAAQALTRLRFQSASGNLTGGTYRLYGVK